MKLTPEPATYRATYGFIFDATYHVTHNTTYDAVYNVTYDATGKEHRT